MESDQNTKENSNCIDPQDIVIIESYFVYI